MPHFPPRDSSGKGAAVRFFVGFITACVVFIGGVLVLESARPDTLASFFAVPRTTATARQRMTALGVPTAVRVAPGEYIEGSVQVGQQSISLSITNAGPSTIGPLLFRWSCSLLPA